MMQRQIFQISTGSSPQGDTGGPVSGELVQVRWNPTTADTGGDIQLAILPRAGDSGDGFVFLDDNDCLGVNFNRVPTQSRHNITGAVVPADTGAVEGAPVYAHNDRLRVKITPGGAAVAGRLYLWWKS